ncbi:MAG: tRNA pseudouridine(55) synthase TruB [Candidatus Eisenbacteria bacterium]
MDLVLVVDKPSGLTSHDVVGRLRRSTGVRRIGHAGTLDPGATGVLVVLVGKATRLSAFLMETQKAYRGRIVLGVTTDTQDADGRVTATRPVGDLDEGTIRAALAEFTGDLEQVPPMTSAIKRDGTPLYELARKGIVVERDPRPVTVESFDLLSYEPPEIAFEMTCSKGTYVRTLAADVGERLGPGAHLGRLERTRVGRFSIEDAAPLSELEALGRGVHEAGYSMFDALSSWRAVLLDERLAETVMFGGAVRIGAPELAGVAEGDHVRLTRDGTSLLAVGLVGCRDTVGSAEVRPVRVFEAL